METEIHSQIITQTHPKQKEGKKRLEVKFSFKRTTILLSMLVFCLFLGYLASNPAIRSKASSLYGNSPAVETSAIPGLTYKGLAKHMRAARITCQPAVQTETGFTGTCAGLSPEGIVDIQIRVFGKTSEEIETLQIDMVQYLRSPSKELFTGALGEVAALPYKGYKPNAARAWVEKSLDVDKALDTFGGVRYELLSYGPSMKRMFIGKPR